MSVRVYVGNLPKEVERQDLEAVFADCSEELVSVKLIADRKTGKCRGFGFVTVKTDEQADAIVEKFNGFLLQETPLKVEKALPRSKGKNESEAAVEETAAPSARRNNSKRNNNSNRKTSSNTSSSDNTSVQPDPRWAQELEKLKELLAAQTTNS